MMESRNEKTQVGEPRDEDRHGLLHRIEEKLYRLLGRRDDEWHERAWAPLDSPFATYSPNDPAPRLFGGPRADAPGWDPSLARPRFDRIDPGSVGTHAAHPTASYPASQTPMPRAHSSAREYYILMQERGEAEKGEADCYARYRARKMRELDREYEDYRRHKQDRFDREFHAWRETRKPGAESSPKPAQHARDTESPSKNQ